MVRRKLLKIGILADLVPLASCDEEKRNVVMRLRVSLRDPDGNAVGRLQKYCCKDEGDCGYGCLWSLRKIGVIHQHTRQAFCADS